MKCWNTACLSEKKQFDAISLILSQSPHLLSFLFDPNQPQLKDSPDRLLLAARGLCSSEYLLLRLALDLWCEQGQVKIHELFNLEPEVFAVILQALKGLRDGAL